MYLDRLVSQRGLSDLPRRCPAEHLRKRIDGASIVACQPPDEQDRTRPVAHDREDLPVGVDCINLRKFRSGDCLVVYGASDQDVGSAHCAASGPICGRLSDLDTVRVSLAMS